MKEFVEERLKLKRNVLVVDDVEVERKMLQHMLIKDYNVLLAANGREALDIMNQVHDTLSLVLLDILMPEVDGYEVLHEMGKNEKLSDIPVIVLTCESSAERVLIWVQLTLFPSLMMCQKLSWPGWPGQFSCTKAEISFLLQEQTG